jgi:rhamnosyltransferase
MISVVISVKNGASTLARCLKSIREQTLPVSEIIVIDSGSVDDSRCIAKSFEVVVKEIPPEEFDHGLTRNMGVQMATGDLVFLTVQDAWLPDTGMLEKMAKHFEDQEVMAVTGHQAVPHEKDKNPLRWYHPYSKPQVSVRQVTDIDTFKSLPQSEQQELVAWDNVVAMYRRKALIELPFIKTEMSEDWRWSYQALLRGWKLLRDPSLVVYHYHHQTFRYVFNTTWSVNYHFYKFFRYKPALPSVIKPTLQAVYHLFRNKELNLREKVYWSVHNFMARLGEWYADFDFLWRMKRGGENRIERGYGKYCKKIPQGRLKR